jgi:hypothetical protein
VALGRVKVLALGAPTGYAGGFDQRARDRVGGHAHGNRVQALGDQAGHAGGAAQDQRQWSGPEVPRQLPRFRRHLAGEKIELRRGQRYGR